MVGIFRKVPAFSKDSVAWQIGRFLLWLFHLSFSFMRGWWSPHA
jgi:hypothetical protein